MNAFLTTLGLLTRIPIPGNGSKFDDRTLSKSIIFFPVAGGIIGIVNAGLFMLLNPYLPRSVLSVFIIALPIFISGGIHFDGLMDTCDGIFSGRSRERSLEIMRDSRVGSMGVIAGILNVILRYSILVELPASIVPMLLIAQLAAGRWAMALGVHFFPYARKDGVGKSFNSEKKILYVILSSLFALLIALLVTGAAGSLIVLIVGGLALLIACWVKGKLGGLTGDVYGALNEVSENVFLILWMVGSITFHLNP